MAFTLCASVNSPNTGAVNCDKSMGKWQYLIKTDKAFTANEYATAVAWIAALRAAGLLPRTNANKAFTFPIILNLEDASTQNTTGNLGDGPVEIIQEGAFGATGGFKATGRQVENLRSLANGQAARYFVIDEFNLGWGYKTAAGTFIGIKLDIFVNSDRPRFQGAVKGQVMTISASDPKEFAQSRYIALPSDFVASNYGVLNDVQLYRISNSSNVFKVDGLVNTGEVKNSQSAYANFLTLLNSASLWYVKRLDTNAAVTITSVASDTSLLCYTFTMDSTAFTALPLGTVLEIGWAPPTDLDPAGVTGVEGLSFTYTKP